MEAEEQLLDSTPLPYGCVGVLGSGAMLATP